MSILKEMQDFFGTTGEVPQGEDRFVLQSYLLGGMQLYMITDRVSGVSYLTKPGNDCPLTPLLDVDGTPLLNE